MGTASLAELLGRCYGALSALELDVALLETDECARLVPVLARIERLARLRKTEAARRATVGGACGRDGAPDAASWLARHSGESVGAAKAAMETMDALAQAPATAAALADGEISMEQARHIASAPEHEEELLDLARQAPVSTLRERARRRRHEGIDPEELHRRQVAARRFRSWTSEVGNVAFAGELPPDVGVPFINRLAAETDRAWREANRAGKREPREAYAADAFVRMLDGAGRGKAKSADVVLVVDLRAWRRGEAEPGEVCHIVGGGGVPVRVAKELAVDAFFKAVIHDGVDILTVAHLGRRMSAELRTALELGTAPELDGLTCVEAGCGRRHGLEMDHVDPVANDGQTSYRNLQPRCGPHHDEKTERDRQAGLLGPRAQGAGRARAPALARAGPSRARP